MLLVSTIVQGVLWACANIYCRPGEAFFRGPRARGCRHAKFQSARISKVLAARYILSLACHLLSLVLV